jgi:ABC-2 type transport system ATP-binding protein
MSISVSNVSKLYGSQKALDQVSFEVKPGEIVGFLGPNGAGKSTMMKIISGFIPQSDGTVSVCGMNILEKEMDIKRKLGYLPENNPLYHEMYVVEYLLFIGGLYGVKNIKTRVEEIIERVGLKKEKNKKIGDLSKGYKQRVGLAQAFIHNPDVLILDEPTTGLDPNQILEIRHLIKEIGKDKTVMLSTHIMQEVEAICDRAIIINEGVIVADEDVKSLMKSGKSGNKLLVEFNKIAEEVLLKKTFIKDSYKIVEKNIYEFYGDDISSVRKSVMRFSVDSDLEIINMSEGSNNLEDVFRDLTKKV